MADTDRTDTDALPPPEVISHHLPTGVKAYGYTAATVRRLLDEQSERIARLEEALQAICACADIAAREDSIRQIAQTALEADRG